MLKSILSLSVAQNASDLHLSSGAFPCLRINGQLQFVSDNKLSSTQLETELFALLDMCQVNKLQQYGQLDLAFHNEIGRFRVNIFYQQRGISAVFRIINDRIAEMSEIGVPAVLKTLVNQQSGIILVTGATGSGKSTTLASLIQYINQTQAKHIITLEDPIEYIYQNDKSLIEQRELSQFDQAMESLLRQDPDIILFGELRNKQSIEAALSVAETGHLVLATLHTRSAIETINRLIDVFEGNAQNFIRSQLSDSLQAIVCQQLITVDNQRKALFEVLINTPAVANLIKEGKTKQILSLIQTGQQHGMQLMPDTHHSIIE